VEGKELFEKHAQDWLKIVNATGQPLEVAIMRGKAQILADVRSGRVPKTVSSFGDLHDYVDANYYGNAFDWPALPSEIENDAYQQAHSDLWNGVQNSLSDWIVSGQMREDLRQRGAGNGRS
jgi:hypothetical protein